MRLAEGLVSQDLSERSGLLRARQANCMPLRRRSRSGQIGLGTEEAEGECQFKAGFASGR